MVILTLTWLLLDKRNNCISNINRTNQVSSFQLIIQKKYLKKIMYSPLILLLFLFFQFYPWCYSSFTPDPEGSVIWILV